MCQTAETAPEFFLSDGTPVSGAVVKRNGKYLTSIRRVCGRCGGDGIYSRYHGVCYGCGGAGGDIATVRAYTRAQADKLAQRRERAAEKREAKRLAAAEAKAQRMAAAFAEWSADKAEAVQAIAAHSDSENQFMATMAYRVTHDIPLSENQLSAALRCIEQQRQDAEAAANAQPVPTGRVEIAGVIRSIREQDSGFGVQLKMLVADDRGFKVWGSVPSSIYLAADRGVRVTFTATVEPSRDDETFGFFKRPTKATAAEENAEGAGNA